MPGSGSWHRPWRHSIRRGPTSAAGSRVYWPGRKALAYNIITSMSGTLFQEWQPAFLQHVQDASTAAPLKEAALAGQLADWTASLTAAVVRSCEALGWRAAGKGHHLALLPQAGQEYLGIDVIAFAG